MDEDLPAPPLAIEPIGHDRLAADPPPPTPWAPRARTPWTRNEVLVLLAILVFTGITHFARLGAPGTTLDAGEKQCTATPVYGDGPCYKLIPLDEVHYVPDARDILRYGTESDNRNPDEGTRFVVHPPVGKWFIAAGIAVFGDRPFGWRFFGAVFGSLGVLLIYLLARRLWANVWWAAMAAFLLSVEGLWFVQSRIAMLDIYAASFVLLAVWLLLEDRDRTAPDHRGRRWWRLGAALALGLAVATKWSVGSFALVIVGTALAWEVARILTADERRWLRHLGGLAGSFVLIPAIVYVAAYTPWFLSDTRYAPPLCRDGGRVAQWVCYQGETLSFHRNLEKFRPVQSEEETGSPSPAATAPEETPAKLKPAHPYFTEAWSWPWIGRPVAHSFDTVGEGSAERLSEVLGLPNPAIWWAAFAFAVPLLAWWTFRRGDHVATLLFPLLVAGWAPYLIADVVDRPVFLFYATPMVPFLVLGLVHVFVRMASRWPGSTLAAVAFSGLALSTFTYFYPVLAALPIAREGPFGWNSHMWFSGPLSDCGVADQIKMFCWI